MFIKIEKKLYLFLLWFLAKRAPWWWKVFLPIPGKYHFLYLNQTQISYIPFFIAFNQTGRISIIVTDWDLPHFDQSNRLLLKIWGKSQGFKEVLNLRFYILMKYNNVATRVCFKIVSQTEIDTDGDKTIDDFVSNLIETGLWFHTRQRNLEYPIWRIHYNCFSHSKPVIKMHVEF